jgi:site-specific DNA-methyltransferase (adenine-specific)
VDDSHDTARVVAWHQEDTARFVAPEALEARTNFTWRMLAETKGARIVTASPQTIVLQLNALTWMDRMPADSIHAIITDPPYGLVEYQTKDHAKLRTGRGGVWRIPPAFDGSQRAPVPRFTVLTPEDRKELETFFGKFARKALRMLVPGGHMMLASNPLLSTSTFYAIERAGFEKRGEIIRLVQTLRGGDRPKNSEDEFSDISVMPRSGWEPWGLFRKPLSEPTVAANLRKWGTGGLRRISATEPFRDVIRSAPTRAEERLIAAHPSLKPQKFMRDLVRAALPLNTGIVYDPFAGGGSTLAAAHRLGICSIGTELDEEYARLAVDAIPRLSALNVSSTGPGDDTG